MYTKTEWYDYLQKRTQLPADSIQGDYAENDFVALIDDIPKETREEIGLLFGVRLLNHRNSGGFDDQLVQAPDEDKDYLVLLIDELIENAVRQKASDLHFEPAEDSLKVRYRIDGVLEPVMKLESYQKAALTSRLKIMATMDITETRRPQDGRIRKTIAGKSYDFRVSTMPASFGEKIVIRVLDKGMIKLDLEQLGIPVDGLTILKKELKKPNGLILVTGPTGSGKTTTLYAALNFLMSDEVNIVTVEDPIEYDLPGVNQSQVNAKVDYGFPEALRNILRQDPDKIMIGEIRDHDTLEIAVRASITGHLVLSTLHTNSSIGALTRLLDLGVEPFMVSSCLNLVIAQRLVRKICSHCKTEQSDKAGMPSGTEISHNYYGKGCKYCNYTGYKGRAGVFEFLKVDDALRTMIKDNVPEHEMRARLDAGGFQSIGSLLNEKIRKGETTIDEVVKEGYL